MPIRITQEKQDAANGRQQVAVRVLFDRSDADSDTVEVAAIVRVPAVDSDEQTEIAARQLAKQALEKALAAFPL